MYRRALAARLTQAPAAKPATDAPKPMRPMDGMLNNVGIHMAMFLWLVAVAWRAEDHLTAGLVVLLAGGLAAWRGYGQRGFTVRATFGHVGWCCALIVSVINLRLDVWLATNRGVSVAEIHQIYPMWLVPLFSVSVGLWIGLLQRWPVRTAAV